MLTTVQNEMLAGPISGGGGAENLVTNGTAEAASVSIFTPYADAAGTRPVDGTGGSPSVTTALNTTNPINGIKDFTLIKGATNRQGDGWATTVSIPVAYRGKSLKFSVKYLVTSGTFVAGTGGSTPTDGDVIWYFYDVTNSKLVEPSNIKMFTSSTAFSDVYESTVQFDSTCASVRLIAHVASTSASAYTLQVDDVTLSPQSYVYGSPVSEWTSWTPTGSWNTNVTYLGLMRRNGSEMEYQIRINCSGAPTAASLTVNLPSGHVIDTARILDTVASYGQLPGSTAQLGFATSSSGASLIAKYNTTTSVGLYSLVGSFSPVYNANVVTNVAPVTLGNTDFISMYLKLPIVGLGSTVQMSDQSDTRQEYFSATKSGNQSISNTTTTKVTFDTYTNNSHGSWDTGNNRYVVKTAGPFNLAGTIGYAANATGYRQVSYSINGGTAEVLNQTNSVGASDPTICGFSGTTPYLSAGDYIELFTYQNSGGALNAAFNLARLRITKIAGPQAIAASERVALSVYLNGAYALTNNTFTDFICNAKLYDTHSIYNTSTGVITVPRSGIMTIKTSWLTTNHTPSGAWSLGVAVLKNGTAVVQTVDTRSETSTTTYPHPTVVRDFEVKAGDLVKVQIYRSSTTVYGVFNGGGDPSYAFIDAVIV